MLSTAIYEEEVAGNLDKAVGIYLDLLKKYPDDRPVAAKALYHLGLVSEKMGVQKAAEYFNRLINNYPDQVEVVNLARARLVRLEGPVNGNGIKPEESFKKAEELFKRAEYKAAIAEYERVIRLAPKTQLAREARFGIGQCYLKDKKYDQALATFNMIIQEFPQSTIIPVTELMISQIMDIMKKNPKKSTVVSINDKTILDTVTGIRYTRINTLGGKNDIIKTASLISSVAPNGKYLLGHNKVLPFDNKDSFEVFDSPDSSWSVSSLSPDGTRIAWIAENSISLVTVDPETGFPLKPVQILARGKYQPLDNFCWAPDGEKLALTLQTNGPGRQRNIWTLSLRDSSLTQITNLKYQDKDPQFTRNGLNILYRRVGLDYQQAAIMMSPADGHQPVVIVDSCFAYYGLKLHLSADNEWLIYPKDFRKYVLYRLADKQEQELISPPEVGELISWVPDGNKLFYYKPSYDVRGANMVLSAFGGPPIELGKQIVNPSWLHFWAPDGSAFLTTGSNSAGDKTVFWMVPINGGEPRELDTKGIEYPRSLSPDGTRILFSQQATANNSNQLLVVPVSLKSSGITGPPVVIFSNYKVLWRIPDWSRDGSGIVLSADGDIWICDTRGGSPRRLTATPEYEVLPEWSPDGSMVKFSFNDTLHKVRIIRPSDGSLVRTLEQCLCNVWSPDGKKVAIANINGMLSILSTETWDVRTIGKWNSGTIAQITELTWSPDGRTLAFIGVTDMNTYESHIYFINAAGGKITRMDSDDDGGKNLLRWSPDSKWLSYYSDDGTRKTRLEGILWEADLTDFMAKIHPATN